MLKKKKNKNSFNIIQWFLKNLPEHLPVHLSAESRPVASLQRPTPQSLQSFSAVRPSSFENVPLGQVSAQEDPVNPNSDWYLPGSPKKK